MQRSISLISLLAIVALLAFSSWLPANDAASAGQGKGGEVIAKPTPTPAPKKTTTTKKTPPKSSRTNQAAKSASEAATAAEMIFWNSIKDSTNPDDYRAYLMKYPGGQFAEIAQNKIKALEAAAERSYWENIKNSANPEDLRAYLKKYPSGIYAEAARNQIDALETAAKEAAVKEEAARKEEARRKEEEAAKKRPGAVVKNSIGIELVFIPAGSFMMGSTGTSAAEPVHQVTITQPFYIGKYEVTQAQWQAVMGNNPSDFKDCDQCPVERVSWNDAQEFIRRLNARGDGYSYRLPSEAEWEYACRAGTTTEFAFGNSLSSEQANFNGNYPHGGAAKGVYRQKTVPVGSFQPNAWGLYDMHGNVWEWCEDWYHDSYNGAPVDGSAWVSGGEQKYRVLRGGSWDYYGGGLRSADRFRLYPGNPYFSGRGFRVVALARPH